MNLSPREKDKLLVAMAAQVARRRLERGVKLNHPEAVALIADFVVEGARDGRSVADLCDVGRALLADAAEAAQRGDRETAAARLFRVAIMAGSAGTMAKA